MGKINFTDKNPYCQYTKLKDIYPVHLIINSNVPDAAELAKVGRQSFIESHGHSASEEDVTAYVNSKFTFQPLKKS